MVRITWLLFLTGIIFGAGPCMASCGPILVSYIVSTHKTQGRSIGAYVLFSFARIAVYLILSGLVYTLGAHVAGGIAEDWFTILRFVAGVFIVSIGILLLLGKHASLGFLHRIYGPLIENDKKSICIMGIAVGLLPCAPLLALFSYIGLIAHSLMDSIIFGLSFGLGTLLSPLLLLAVASGTVNAYLVKGSLRLRRFLDIVSGSVIVIMGITLFIR